MSNQVTISAAAALNETALLCDYYRNRNLILAQENQTLREDGAALRKRIEEITKTVEEMRGRFGLEDGTAEVAVQPVNPEI